MKPNLNYIKGLIKKLRPFNVTPKLDQNILKALNNLRVEREFKGSFKKPSFFIYLTHTIMNSFKRYAIAVVAVILVVGGVMHYNQNSYAHHLNNAKSALAQLEAVISGHPSQLTLIPTAFAEGKGEVVVDEEEVEELVEEVVAETEEAIEAAEEITDPEELTDALEDISEVQEEEIEVFSDTAEIVESEEVMATVASALETTSEEQELVEEALEFVATALAAGEEEVSIDIETSGDKEEEEDEDVDGDEVLNDDDN